MAKTVSFSESSVIHFIHNIYQDKSINEYDEKYNDINDVNKDENEDMSDTHKENDKENDKNKKSGDKVYTKYTKFCLFGLGKCRKGMKCVYAHTIKELNIITCKWDEECLRKEKCYFKHSNETKTQYIKRSFPDDIKRLNISLFDENQKIEKINLYEKDEDKDIIESEFDQEAFNKALRDFWAMYYDPIMDVRCWGDIPDSDEESYPYF